MTNDAPGAEHAEEARQSIERALWASGITGDACARVAASVLDALLGAGLVIVRTSD